MNASEPKQPYSARVIKTANVVAVATTLGVEIIYKTMGNDMASGMAGKAINRTLLASIISNRIVTNLEKENG